MISALYILDRKGKIIISRDYRGDVRPSCVDRFVNHILEEDEMNVKPIFEDDGINYVYVMHQDIYCMNPLTTFSNLLVLAVSKRNCDATLVLLFLYSFIKVTSHQRDVLIA